MDIYDLSRDTDRSAPQGIARLGGQTSFSVNLFSNYLGRGWEAAMTIAFVPLYIRFLGAEAYGLIGLLTLIQSFMLILDIGMTPTLTREAARYQAGEHTASFLKDLVRSVEWMIAGLALAIFATLAIVSPWIAEHWVKAEAIPTATIAGALTIGGALIAMRFFESVFRGTLYGLQRQALCNFTAAFFATVRGAGSVAVIVLTDGGLYGFFVWQVIASLCAVLAMRAGITLALPRDSYRAKFSLFALRSVGRFALGMVAISVLSLAATQVDKVVLSRLLSLENFGFYMFAANVALVLELVAAPIMTALYPRVIDFVTRDDEIGLASFFHRWAKVVILLTAPAAAVLTFAGYEVVWIWSGDADLARHTGALLSVLILGSFIHVQCVLPYQIQLAHGWTSFAILVNCAALLLTIISVIVLVPIFGAMAAAWTWVTIASLYFVAMNIVFFRRYLQGQRRRFLIRSITAPSVVSFGTMAIISDLLDFPPDRIMGLLAIFAATAVCFIITAITMIFLEPVLPWSLREVLSKKSK